MLLCSLFKQLDCVCPSFLNFFQIFKSVPFRYDEIALNPNRARAQKGLIDNLAGEEERGGRRMWIVCSR